MATAPLEDGPLTAPRTLLALSAVALLLAGCPPDEGSVPHAFPTIDQAPTPSESDSGKEIIKVCTVLPSSGPSKDLGAAIRRGIDIARSQLDPNGRRQLTWTDKDSRSTEPGAVSAFQECFGEGHHVVIGPVHPAATTALVPIAAAFDTVLVIPDLAAAHPEVWGPNVFAVGPPSVEMGLVAAKDARTTRGLTKGAVLHVPKVFGESIRDAFTKAFTEIEPAGTIVDTRELQPDDPNPWGAAASELAGKGVEALFVVGPRAPAERIAASVATLDMQVWFIDWAMHPPVLEAAGAAGRKRVHWVNRTLPQGSFDSTYRERHQAKPEYAAAAGYDAVLMVETAANRAKSSFYEDLASELRSLENLPTSRGPARVVEGMGVSYLDASGYTIVEPELDPGNQEWIFGGFRD